MFEFEKKRKEKEEQGCVKCELHEDANESGPKPEEGKRVPFLPALLILEAISPT